MAGEGNIRGRFSLLIFHSEGMVLPEKVYLVDSLDETYPNENCIRVCHGIIISWHEGDFMRVYAPPRILPGFNVVQKKAFKRAIVLDVIHQTGTGISLFSLYRAVLIP